MLRKALAFFVLIFTYPKGQAELWETDCILFGKHSYKSQAEIVSDRLVLVVNFYETKSCTIPTIKGIYRGKLSYIKTQENIHFIEHIPSSTQYMLQKKDVVDQWNDPNSKDGCGKKEWKLNDPSEVSGKFCRPFWIPQKDSKVLDLISIEANQMKFGRSPAIVGDPAFDEWPENLSQVQWHLAK